MAGYWKFCKKCGHNVKHEKDVYFVKNDSGEYDGFFHYTCMNCLWCAKLKGYADGYGNLKKLEREENHEKS
jgi:hypothetical protein